MNENIFDQKWSCISLLRFAAPTIIMMLFMGLYTIADTIFVAQFVHTDALSAINMVCPVVNVTVGLGTMIAAGGNAIVSREMGAGKNREAKEDFTLLIITGGVIGFVILICGMIWIDNIIYMLGASNLLFPYCKDYLLILLLFIPANILQVLFSNLFVTAGKPGLGFGLSLLAGIANIVLDYVFIALCHLGIRGAALGTGFGYLIPTIAGLIYFTKNKGTLSFIKPRLKWKVIKESCINGSSEMVSQLAAAVTTFLFNVTGMDLLGENGVAAITIIIYSQFLLNTLYIGYAMGIAPVIGFSSGNKNSIQLKTVFQISIQFIAAASGFIFIISRFGGANIVRLFADNASEVYQIAAKGFSVFSYNFLFCGLNIFTSSMFTALSNGKVSAILSFLRTFGLLAGGILLLPKICGATGIWLAVPFAEGIMFLVSIVCLLCYKEKYSY
ncbi:MAG: MATE family efflux transporter [Lachnospiraceae bacterium]|nr:MATE family efflux transporter [Lachnospiraceae bacterium]